PVNIKAAQLMGKLHDRLLAVGYAGHVLEVYLVRLLFCLFADDTGIFQKNQFIEYIERNSKEDGSDLAQWLAGLFQVLDTPKDKRLKNLDEQLAAFEYINGRLFQEALPLAAFDREMRELLIDSAALDWGKISPAIFGSLFQSIMDKTARRNLGAHYTSETNILKLIKPLFLDSLRAEFDKVKGNRNLLVEFHKKLAALKFLDPACGCGNFLVITYRELRLLEIDILRVLYQGGQQMLDVSTAVWLDVDQFYGIEIEEWPARIAEVAMWLMDHQMNLMISEEFGNYFARLPLKKSAHIAHANALQTDWESVVTKGELSYILGNPPFLGKSNQSKEQKADLEQVCHGVKGAGVLDFVAGWYVKAARYIQDTHIACAFVSTNSITQGEQVAVLWAELLQRYGIKIHFAHRTFKWSNEASGKAAVHCVIIGFANFDVDTKTIFEYVDIVGEPLAIRAQNINPYLVDAANTILQNLRNPICNVPEISFGNMPNDGGHLLLSDDEKNGLVQAEPAAEKSIRPFLGADEFINNLKRWCLWLGGISPNELRTMPNVMRRVKAVQDLRLASTRDATRKLAEVPTLFGEIRQTDEPYILVPRHSSENRAYIPMGYLGPDVICGDSNSMIPNATLYHFGMLTSTMHMAWVRAVCGRLESRYRYSNTIVYNNYPWPQDPSDKQQQAVETAAQAVLDARAAFPGSSLADLYDPLSMPPALVKAHQALDKAVDACYGKQTFQSDAQRVAFLFDLYQHITSLLPAAGGKPKRGKAGG
ncbi:MAG: class I SAM-dependent DNA methyltransferase, partial [Proteobacteria bacterium]|nr:class I SAM-dependent DNA methyltransferase [Pseudomonadota bacterium]